MDGGEEDELMNPEPQKDYEQALALVLRLDKSAQMNLVTDLIARLGHSLKPHLSDHKPQNSTLADILAKAQENLSGLDQDQYWAEREQELAASRTSWEALESGSWRG